MESEDMKAAFVAKMRKNGKNQQYVSIPVEIVEVLGLEEGQILQITVSNDFGNSSNEEF